MRGPLQGHDGEVLSVVFSPDGDLISSASGDKTVRLRNLGDGIPATPPFQGHTGRVRCVVFTPNSARLVSGSEDCNIHVWATSDSSLVTNPFEGHTGYINSNIDDGTLVSGPFIGHTEGIWSVAFSPDRTRVISGSEDKIVRVWSVRDGLLSLPPPFKSHMSNLRSMLLSGNGARILSGSHDSSSWAWDITLRETGIYLPIFAEDYRNNVMNTTDGSIFAESLRGHTGEIVSFGFSADDTHLVTGFRDCTICVWDLHKSASVAAPFCGHGTEVTNVSLLPDHSRVVSCSKEDRTIRVWNTRNVMIPSPSLLGSRSEVCSDDNFASTLEGWVIWILLSLCA
ncbi:WD40 repeat-like protein [Rhizoctonia solani]|nr:WD40 repeat-like protein [Rhizoctonia solani]